MAQEFCFNRLILKTRKFTAITCKFEPQEKPHNNLAVARVKWLCSPHEGAVATEVVNYYETGVPKLPHSGISILGRDIYLPAICYDENIATVVFDTITISKQLQDAALSRGDRPGS